MATDLDDAVISTNVSEGLGPAVARLRKAEYMSPRDGPFYCGGCRYAKGGGTADGVDMEGEPTTFCEKFQAIVQVRGCCGAYRPSPNA